MSGDVKTFKFKDEENDKNNKSMFLEKKSTREKLEKKSIKPFGVRSKIYKTLN